MKLSQDTITVLKNFATINKSIMIDPGNALSTTLEFHQSVMAYAEVSETFDTSFPIFDLHQFLNIFAMFEDPDLRMVEGRKAIISEGKSVVNYTFAESHMIKTRMPTDIKPQRTVASFEMKAHQLSSLIKAAAIMQLNDILVEGKNGKITIGALNANNSSSNTYKIEVGETDASFYALYQFANFRQLIRDYKVTITPVFAKFDAIDDKLPKTLSYWIAANQGSKF